MTYQRYYSGNDWRDDADARFDDQARYEGRSSAREYRAAGLSPDPRDRYRDEYGPYGERSSHRGSARYSRDPYAPRRAGPRRDATPADYDYDDRGFFSRAGDEVRSWFGDEDAERRRSLDRRYDEQRDGDYLTWRERQIDSLDRDYHDYRRERQQQFDRQFGDWRSERDQQRSMLAQVTEHMDVEGSDGQHVGTVDKVRGDRIILTKSDADAGGHHHSIPVRWIKQVADKVTLTKTADEAQQLWRDEERGAMFGGDRSREPQPISYAGFAYSRYGY